VSGRWGVEHRAIWRNEPKFCGVCAPTVVRLSWVEQETVIDIVSRRHGHHWAIPASCQSEEGVFARVAYDGLARRA
jgi:hypothetical protein